MQAGGGAAAYEVWNEEDETDFWGAAVDAAHYAAILKAAYPRIKAGRPGAKVLLGPLTGNNYNFLGQVYAAGAGSSFDAAAVHTDTACLVDPPSSFYRDGGNVARFTFLGFRTVHDVMAANGDGAKPIWMTELGWTTTTTTCARGMWAGQKPSGVTEAAQAANLKEAYHCLAGYPYIETGDVVHAQGHQRQRRRARPLRAAAPSTARTSPPGTPSRRWPRAATSSPGRAVTSTLRR